MNMFVITIAVLAGVVFGAGVTALAAWDIYRRADERNDWTVRWLHETDVRAIAATADHDHRLAARCSGELDALADIHVEVVGDLLDKVAERDARLGGG